MRAASAGFELAAIEKRGVKNELNARFNSPRRSAARKGVQGFVPERVRDCPVAQPHEIQNFAVVARRTGRDEPEVGVCLAILAGQFFQFGGAWVAAKAAFQHRRVLRLGGGACARGAIRFFHFCLASCASIIF
jgi:hypothetical protein